MVSAMIRTPLHAPLRAAAIAVFVLGSAAAARAAEGGATPPPAASCVEQDKKVAEQAAEIARLNKRIEELEDELDLMDMQ